MQQTPVNPSVKLHSIIGTGSPFSDGTPADGIVPVYTPGIRRGQRALVGAEHSDLPDHPDAIAEVVRVLGEHLQAYDAAQRAPQ